MRAETVETTFGPVAGRYDGVHMFKGIPYAAAPTRQRRFHPPQPREPWSEAFDASEFGPSCPQPTRGAGNQRLAAIFAEFGMPAGEAMQDEDCLVLNVWTPGLSRTHPVLFRIHGGGFVTGSGSWPWYDGANLAQRGFVVITVNHRLGPLGYLYLDQLAGPEYLGSGNAGMLDLVAALEWVRDNIAAFGGDAGNVTIFGESGGGYKVSTLLAMPAAKGLFHRAIVQSGPGLTALDPEVATSQTEALLSELGVDPTSPEALSSIFPRDLLAADVRLGTPGIQRWAPVRQPNVIPVDPGDAVAEGVAASVPLLIGTTRHEATMFLAMESVVTGELPRIAGDDEVVARMAHIAGDGAAALVSAYRAAQSTVSSLELLAVIQSDFMMRRSSVALAERQVDGGGTAYAYLLALKSPALDGFLMASHGLCVPLTMANVGTSPAVDTPDGRAVSQAMSEAWLAFARTGDPSCEPNPSWPPFSKERRETMVFDRHTEVVNDPYGDQLRAWG
jgi:para-nitrobenzyl esterase